METAKTLVRDFVTSKLDNCNALLYGLPKYKIQRLQHVLICAARPVTLSRKHDHISPVLMELHCLPVEHTYVQKCMQWRKWRNIANLWRFELDAKSGPSENRQRAGDIQNVANIQIACQKWPLQIR